MSMSTLSTLSTLNAWHAFRPSNRSNKGNHRNQPARTTAILTTDTTDDQQRRRLTVDAYLNIIGKREVRKYTDEPIPDDTLTNILHGGRVTGSARNRQQWEMVVVRNRETLQRLAETVAAPDNIRGCAAAVAVV